MDYTKQSRLFQVKKAARYVHLYGISRTLIKVESQRNMDKAYEKLPDTRKERTSQRHVGLLGCGKFGFGNIAYYLDKTYGKMLRGCMDTHINRAASLFEKY